MKKSVKAIIGMSVLFFLSFLLKISFVWGSKKLFFPGFCVIMPLMGAFFGAWTAGFAMIFAKIGRYVLASGYPSITLGIPTMAACWCWSLERQKAGYAHIFVNIIIPLGCLVAFILHPSVGCGFWYGLYWVIPVFLYVAQLIKCIGKNLFVTALRSTFIAHALGSVIWCYTIPMTPDKWLALIPIVAVERLVFASGMVLLYFVFKMCASHCKPKTLIDRFYHATFSHDNGW